MENVPCNICGEENSVRLQLAQHQFSVVRCPGCGLVFLNPRPTVEEMQVYYPPAYAPYLLEARDDLKGALVEKFTRRTPGRLLDIGCSTGAFLEHMKSRGWSVAGVEINRRIADEASRRVEAQIYVTLEDARGQFDAVTMWAVIEHMHDPSAALRLAHRLLDDSGRLLIATQNFDSIDRRLFGSSWYDLDLPRHVYQFTPETIEAILWRNGFEVDRLVFFVRPGAWVKSVRRLLGHKQIRVKKKKQQGMRHPRPPFISQWAILQMMSRLSCRGLLAGGMLAVAKVK